MPLEVSAPPTPRAPSSAPLAPAHSLRRGSSVAVSGALQNDACTSAGVQERHRQWKQPPAGYPRGSPDEFRHARNDSRQPRCTRV